MVGCIEIQFCSWTSEALPNMPFRPSIGFFLYILTGLFLTGCDSRAVPEAAVASPTPSTQETYVCPMHPNILRHEPGHCPVCGMDLVPKTEKAETENPVVELSAAVVQKLGVRTAEVKRGRLWRFIRTVGEVDYDHDRVSILRTRTFGWVENLSIRRAGLEVKKGQLLLELYAPEFLVAQRQFIAAQRKDQSGILRPYGQRQESVAVRDFLRYLGISESLMNEIARTGKPRFRIPVFAPQYGVVIRHQVHKRMYVPAGFPMMTIADVNSMWVHAHVYEHQLRWVRRGQLVEVTSPALPGETFTGQINYVEPELDPETRTLRVRILVPNPDRLLQPNMFAEVKIFGGPKNDVLKIPRQALIVTGEREVVILALGNGRFRAVNVVSGMRSGDEVEILSGLEPGQKVVVSGQFLLDSEANLQASLQRFEDAR